MTRTHESWTSEEAGAALASAVHARLGVSHRQAKGLIDAGCVTVNGEPAHSHGLRLQAGDQVAVAFDPERVYTVLPKPSRSSSAPFQVLWEDKHLVFVDKPAGLLTVPAEKHNDPCLAEAITDLYRRRGFKRFQLFIVHRLDRYTSGVLVFAKTPEALNGLKHIFDEHHLRRVYIAVLTGELPENAGTLTDHLVERKSLRMSVVREGSKAPKDVKGGKLAVTHYRVLERLPGHTVVEVKLETGRRNQIRVQFAERGFPLLGDQVYGQASDLLDRQALHAELLGFRHPVTDETVTVSSPMPADLERALKALRTARRVVRAEAGVTGEEGLYKPKITRTRKIERRKRAERYGEPEAAPRKPSTRPRAADGETRAARPTRSSGTGHPSRAPKAAGAARPARTPRAVGETRPVRTPRTADPTRPARATKSPSEGRPPRAAGSPRPAGARRAPARPKTPPRKG